jgi:hypothetical protein
MDKRKIGEPTPFHDVMTIEGAEGFEAASERDYYSAMQRQINAGQWSLQGSHGRAMMQAIEEGHCMLGKQRARDYWGNTIPSRDDVQPGTKGSVAFVANQHDPDWADHMEAL